MAIKIQSLEGEKTCVALSQIKDSNSHSTILIQNSSVWANYTTYAHMYVFGGPSWIPEGLWSEMQLTGLGMYPNVVHSLYALADLIYHDCCRLRA